MAQRRMFSPEIVCSDAFLDMPSSSRDLYYQLGMYADDDGFVNPRKIMRMISSSEDDLKILIAKRFVLSFPSGVLVVKHWKINNLVRKDWYRPTQYIEEKSTLYLKDNNSYTEDPSKGIKLVNEPLTQVRLGKVRLNPVENENQILSLKEKKEPTDLKEITDWVEIDFQSEWNKLHRLEKGMWVVRDKKSHRYFYHNKKFYEYKKII